MAEYLHSTWAISAGPSLLGVFVSTFASGILTLQAFVYFYRYRDAMWMRLLVGSVWFLEMLHMVLYWIVEYITLINYFGDYVQQMKSNLWAFKAVTIITPIVTVIVQAFLAYRAWRLDKSKIIFASTIAVVALAQLIVGLYVTAGVWAKYVLYQQLWFENESKVLGAIWLGSMLLCDVLITISLVTSLMQTRTGFKRTDSMIFKLIVYTVNTGLLTSIWSLVGLLLFIFEDSLLHSAFNIVLARLYANTLLAILNTRKPTFKDYAETTGDTERNGVQLHGVSQNSMARSFNMRGSRAASRMQPNQSYGVVTIEVMTDQFEHFDIEKETLDPLPPTPASRPMRKVQVATVPPEVQN